MPAAQDKRLYPLTSCSIGIWRAPDDARSYLLVLQELPPPAAAAAPAAQAAASPQRGSAGAKQRGAFVILVTREPDGEACQRELSVNGLLARARSRALKWVKHKNPFVDHTSQPDSDASVLTFEVAWPHVVGLDFRWPLTEDARLVLEASQLAKRVFASVEDVCRHYGRHQPAAPAQNASRRPRTLPQLAAAERAAEVAAAAAAAAAAQRQQQPQPKGAGGAAAPGQQPLTNKLLAAVNAVAGAHAGGLSRVSSWTSWASWTSGGGACAGGRRSTEEQTTAATSVAAATGTASQAGAGQQQQQSRLAHSAASWDQSQCSPCSCCGATGSASATSGFGCGDLLCNEPTLSAGLAQRCSAAAGGHGGACAAACSSGGELGGVPLHTPLACGCRERPGSASPDIPSAWSAARRPAPLRLGEELERPASPLLAVATAEAAAPASAPSAAAGAPQPAALAAASALEDLRAESFGFWAAHPAGGGYATAPASLPCSPRVGGEHVLLQGIEQPLLLLYQQQQQLQQLQEEHGQALGAMPVPPPPQQQQPRRRRPAGGHHGGATGGGSGGTRLGGRHQRSASADRACPLCHQALVQPLHVLQQRFHHQQEVKQARGPGRTSSGGARSARALMARSRSACSLEQLLQLPQAASSGGDGGAQQHLQPPPPPLQLGGSKPPSAVSSPRVPAGLAAAVGGLAARWRRQGPRLSIGSASGLRRSSSPGGGSDTAGGPTGTPLGASGQGDAAAPASGAESASAAHDDSCGSLQPAADCDLQQPTVAAVEPAAAAVAEACRRDGGGAGGGAAPLQGGGPPAAAAAATRGAGPASPPGAYRCRTVVLTFKDPTLPHQLRQVVNRDMNLLKLYESGLPAWAVLLPSYGLWYRPWLRRVTWLLFVLLSVVSMAMGFYDLWSQVPYFKGAIIAMFRPAAAVFEWLEGHTQIRLSILLTYMVGKSQLFVQVVKLLTQTSLKPLVEPLAALLAPLAAAASAAAGTVAWLGRPFVAAGRLLLGPLGRLAWALALAAWRLLSLLLWSGPLQLLASLGQGLLAAAQVLLLPLQALLPGVGSLRAGWSVARATGQVARSAAPVVKGAAAGGLSPWLWWAAPLVEALEVLRVSTLRIVRALQAVLRFVVALASTVNKHRLSLMLQLRQKLRGGLRAAALSPAGRVANAVALKMGQEGVARLQQRLERSDSGLISATSELPADSALTDTAALTLNGDLSVDSPALLRLRRRTSSDGEDEDEVTSGMTAAPPTPPGASASPAVQLHGSVAGLRHRLANTGGAGAGAGARVAWQQRLAGGAGSKQVTFADGAWAAAAPGGGGGRGSPLAPQHAVRRSADVGSPPVTAAGWRTSFWAAPPLAQDALPLSRPGSSLAVLGGGAVAQLRQAEFGSPMSWSCELSLARLEQQLKMGPTPAGGAGAGMRLLAVQGLAAGSFAAAPGGLEAGGGAGGHHRRRRSWG